MGFFDGLFGTLNNLNPMQQTSSMLKYIIGAILLLIVFFMIWVTFLAKSHYSPAPSARDRVFGIMTKATQQS